MHTPCGRRNSFLPTVFLAPVLELVMTPKHLLLIPACTLLFFLGIYSWNQRTDILDTFSVSAGLEAAGVILKFTHGIQDTLETAWSRYVDLVNVREENERLQQKVHELTVRLALASENNEELKRLRELLRIPPPEGWQVLGTRVLGRRMGPNSPLIAMTIGRGYLTGATPETPVMTPDGIAGLVYRSGPSISTVLLLNDPSIRISVVGQKNRVQGILAGSGMLKPLELMFVPHSATFEPDELLVTSGLDNIFPKGVPVARVIAVNPSKLNSFLSVQAVPLAKLSELEDVLLLVRTPASPLPASGVPNTPSQKEESR